MKFLQRVIALGMGAAMLLGAITGCGSSAAQGSSAAGSSSAQTELHVFAAASMTETLNQIADLYQKKEPNVKLVYTFDSSGTLKTQIQQGADCDVFISAAQKQMNQLDSKADPKVNTENLDFVLQGTRVNLLQNKVVLIVPKNSTKGITSFADVATDKVSMIALGNSDVPVGQYSEELFKTMKLWDKLNQEKKITLGTNVKEVLTQVAEGAVDCGVVYATDAATNDKVKVVAEAPAASHKPVIYPAAVMKNSKHVDEAKAFLDYLQTDDCKKVFKAAGFTIPSA